MPKGPRGEKRPGDVIGAAVMVARIATGQIEDEKRSNMSAAAIGRLGGLKGGKARAKRLSASKRKQIAKKGASARWGSE